MNRENILLLRNQKNKIRWKNLSGEIVPAYGVVKLRAYNSTGKYYEAVKPDGDGSLHYLSGPVEVAVDEYGESSLWNEPSLGLTFASLGTTVGPVADSWAMSEEGTGFVVFGPETDGIAAIIQLGGGGGVGLTMWFTIEGVLCPGVDYVDQETLVVSPIYREGSCAVPPGANYDGTYDVIDICNYLHGLTESDLLGTIGRATYMYPLSGYCNPVWIIDDLCAQPEC